MDDGFPILVLEDDGNGFNIHFHRDDHEFPRLAWSMLSPKHGACKAGELGHISLYRSFFNNQHFLGHVFVGSWYAVI